MRPALPARVACPPAGVVGAVYAPGGRRPDRSTTRNGIDSASLFTLFQVMTVEGWPEIARGVMTQSPRSWICFVVYLLIATFMVLNLFIAVVVNAMQSQVTEDLQHEGEAHTRLVLDEVRALRRELEALRGPSQS